MRTTDQTFRDPRRRQAGNCLPALAFVLAAVILAVLLLRWSGPRLLEGYARWLVVEDTVENADAAVALGGGDGQRLYAAIRLYKSGQARNVLITGPDIPLLKVYTEEDSLTQGEAKRRIAVNKGVPSEAALLALGPTSTWEEAQRTLEEVRAHGWRRIVVVTDPFHTRRARATFRRVFDGSAIEVGIYHLPPDLSVQTVERWWQREGDYMAVLTETMKMVYYMYHYRIRP